MSTKPQPSNNNRIGRNIIEEQSYTDSVATLGGERLVDLALNAIMDGLCNKPEGFDLVPSHEPIRIAKTDRIERNCGSIIPALRLWFVIENDENIRLLYVEETPNEE